MGLPSPVPLRTVPDPKKVEASLRHGHGDSGLVAVPGHGGAVPVIDGQRVGLGVEHPVLWRQHVIFREQKIEVSVWRGRSERVVSAQGKEDHGRGHPHLPGLALGKHRDSELWGQRT